MSQNGFGKRLDRPGLRQVGDAAGRDIGQILDLLAPKLGIAKQPREQNELRGGGIIIVRIGSVVGLHVHAA